MRRREMFGAMASVVGYVALPAVALMPHLLEPPRGRNARRRGGPAPNKWRPITWERIAKKWPTVRVLVYPGGGNRWCWQLLDIRDTHYTCIYGRGLCELESAKAAADSALAAHLAAHPLEPDDADAD